MSDTTTNVTIVNTTIENSGESSVTTSPRAMYGVVNLIGRSSEGGGEIFGNYVDNKAYGFYSAAFGNHSVAGKKICKLDSLIDETNQTITLNSVLNNNVEGQYFSYKLNNGTLYSFAAKVEKQEIISQKTVLTFDILFLKNYDVPTTNDYIWFPESPEIGLSFEEIEELLEYTPAFSAGNKTYASGTGSVGFGYNNLIPGSYGLAAGLNNKASYASAVFGRDNQIFGNYSLGAGLWNIVKGDYGVALGRGQFAFGRSGVAIGDATENEAGLAGIDMSKLLEHWDTNKNINIALGDYSFALGKDNKVTGIGALGFGYRNQALGDYSFAFGNNTIAKSKHDIAIGYNAQAEGSTNATNIFSALAIGESAKALKGNAIALGFQTQANNTGSIAIGRRAIASGAGEFSLSIGYATEATGLRTVSIGSENKAQGNFSTVFGKENRSTNNYQTIIGQGNADNSNALFIIGNGDRDSAGAISERKNIFWVNQDGIVETNNSMENDYLKYLVNDIGGPLVISRDCTIFTEYNDTLSNYSNTIRFNPMEITTIGKKYRLEIVYENEAPSYFAYNDEIKVHFSNNPLIYLKVQRNSNKIICDFTSSVIDTINELSYITLEVNKPLKVNLIEIPDSDSQNYFATTKWVDKYISNIINTTSGNSPSAGVNINNISQLANAMNLIWNGNTGTADETINYLYYDKDNVIQTGSCKIAAGFSGIASIYDEFVQGPTEEEDEAQATKLWTIISGFDSFNNKVRELACAPSNNFSVASGKTATFGGNVTINGTTNLNNNLIVASDKIATFGGKVIINGITELKNNLTVASGKTATFGGKVTINGITELKNNLTVASGKTATFGGETEFNDKVTFNDNIKLGTTALNSLKKELSLRYQFYKGSLGKGKTYKLDNNDKTLFNKYNIFEIEFDGLLQNCLVTKTGMGGKDPVQYLRGINGGVNTKGEITFVVVDLEYNKNTGVIKVRESYFYNPYKGTENNVPKSSFTKHNKAISYIHGIA